MTNTKIAFIYDFDKTLSLKDMQEYSFLPGLNIKPNQFWRKVEKTVKTQGADNILAYMSQMIKEAVRADKKNIITKTALKKIGKSIELFKGVEQWFGIINTYAKSKGINIEHYIISSGNKEIIEGTSIFSEFKKVYGCKFLYDEMGVAIGPGLAINYTNKTQFIFRINKGLLDEKDHSEINTFIPWQERNIPFENMVYFGDGDTDIPCMKLVKDKGGYSIAVYKPKCKKDKVKALLKEGRINFYFPADYSLNKEIYNIAINIIDKMAAQNKLIYAEIKQKQHL